MHWRKHVCVCVCVGVENCQFVFIYFKDKLSSQSISLMEPVSPIAECFDGPLSVLTERSLTSRIVIAG